MLELQLALEQQGVKSAKPHAVENPCIAFDFPKTSLILWYLRGIDSRTPSDTKISRCSSPLHKMLKMHTVGPLHPQIPTTDVLICRWESVDVKPGDMEDRLCI